MLLKVVIVFFEVLGNGYSNMMTDWTVTFASRITFKLLQLYFLQSNTHCNLFRHKKSNLKLYIGEKITTYKLLVISIYDQFLNFLFFKHYHFMKFKSNIYYV